MTPEVQALIDQTARHHQRGRRLDAADAMSPQELHHTGYGPLPECGDKPQSDTATWIVIVGLNLVWAVPLILWAIKART